MNKNIIVILLVISFLCMYIDITNSLIFDVVGISIMVVCALTTSFSKKGKK